ncbi:hypothetical protein EV714DRAFT_232834 [Schizophyllum commune]
MLAFPGPAPMTSFIIKAHLNRRIHPDWLRKDAEVKMIEDDPATCTFCRIIRGELPARKVFENEEVVAFLGALGAAVSKVCNALVKGTTQRMKRKTELTPTMIALDHTALNVVCNQEYAQAVPHAQITDLVQRNRTLEHTVKKLTEQVHSEQRRADERVDAEREAKRAAIDDVKNKWRVEYDRWRGASADLHVCHTIVQAMTYDEMLEAEADILKARQATEREIARRVEIECEKLRLERRSVELEVDLETAQAEWEVTVAAQQAEIDKLRARLADGRADATSVERERDELEDKLAELREEHANALASHEGCASTIERSALQIESLKTKVADVERTAEELRRTNADLQRQVDKWQSFETRGSEESATLRRDKVQLEIRVRELEDRLEKKDEMTQKLKQKIRDNKEVVESWQSYVAERDADFKRLEAESVDLKKVIAKLQKKLEAAQEQAEQMLAERQATEPEPSDEPAKPKKNSKARSKKKDAIQPIPEEDEEEEEDESAGAGPSRSPPAEEVAEEEPKPRRKRQAKARKEPAEEDFTFVEAPTESNVDQDEAAVAEAVVEPTPEEDGATDLPRKAKRKRPTPEEAVESEESQPKKASKRRAASTATESTTTDDTSRKRAGSRKPESAPASKAKKPPPSSRKVARGESATAQPAPSRKASAASEEGGEAPAKKMKKINIFPTQPAPMFDFSAKPQVLTSV